MIRIHPSIAPLPIRPETFKALTDWGISLIVRDPASKTGGGYWWPEQKKVELFTAQEEAAIHELAHAYWERRRLENATAAKLMVAVVKLSEEPDPRYARAAGLARQYVYGIPTQADPNSPTGWWRGMLAEGNDWEMFAGLASGTMGNLSLLPPYVRSFYVGLFDESSEQR